MANALHPSVSSLDLIEISRQFKTVSGKTDHIYSAAIFGTALVYSQTHIVCFSYTLYSVVYTYFSTVITFLCDDETNFY